MRKTRFTKPVIRLGTSATGMQFTPNGRIYCYDTWEAGSGFDLSRKEALRLARHLLEYAIRG